MLETWISITAAICGGAGLLAYVAYKDTLHPMLYLMGMCAFMYVYMPLELLRDGDLYSFVTEEQAVFGQQIIAGCLLVMALGCLAGSGTRVNATAGECGRFVNPTLLRQGAYAIGGTGLLCWSITIQGAGGLVNAFSHVYGMGWSEFGFIREGIYLLIAALLLLLAPETFAPKNKFWQLAVCLLAFPWVIQGLLGARRGPTIVIVTTLVMSWYLARGKRPALPLLVGGAGALGFFVLFLVTNRSEIYIGSDFEVSTENVGKFFEADPANEYIFAIGCITTSHQTGYFFWGRRYLAQILVRPIPKQIWPTKYEDFGVPELLQNAGVAGPGLETVMGWQEIPGAAAGMVGDFWVELSWLAIPLCGFIGWGYGYVWRRAITEQRFWTTFYMILTLLSLYMVTQSGEAVIFRFIALTLPSYYAWKNAMQPATVPTYAPAAYTPLA